MQNNKDYTKLLFLPHHTGVISCHSTTEVSSFYYEFESQLLPVSVGIYLIELCFPLQVKTCKYKSKLSGYSCEYCMKSIHHL